MYALAVVALMAASPKAMELPTKSGLHKIEMKLAGDTARVSVWLPDGFDSKRPTPLVVSLHYGGQVTPFYGAGLLQQLMIDALGEPLEAIVVGPDAQPDDWSGPKNAAMLKALYAQLADAYTLDRRRILLTGYSRGGIGTWTVGAAKILPITGAIPISGAPPAEPSLAVPTHAVHSKADSLFSVEPTRAAVAVVNKRGVEAELTVIESPGHYDIVRFRAAVKRAGAWMQRRWDASDAK